MSPGTNRTHDVASIELAHGEKIERGGKQADPSGAAHRMKKQVGGLNVRLEDCAHELQGQRHAENDVSISVRPNRGNDLGVEHTISQSGHSE